MYMLSRCQYLVYNQTSSFGVIARLLSDAPDHHITDTSPFDPSLPLKRLYHRIRGYLPLPGK
jgi:hypothetical protein